MQTINMPAVFIAAIISLYGCGNRAINLDEIETKVKPGMTFEQVREIAGNPNDGVQQVKGGKKGWGYHDQKTGSILSIVFEDGKVVKVSRIKLE